MEIPLFERKDIAIQKYGEYSGGKLINAKEKDFFEEYIGILKLLLLDETNKDIAKLYLHFIKNNEISVKNHGLATFNEEIKKYKLLFTIDEMKTIAPGIKEKSEKDERNLVITLTDKGKHLKDKALCVPLSIAKEVNLTESEAAALYATLYKILNYKGEQ